MPTTISPGNPDFTTESFVTMMNWIEFDIIFRIILKCGNGIGIIRDSFGRYAMDRELAMHVEAR